MIRVELAETTGCTVTPAGGAMNTLGLDVGNDEPSISMKKVVSPCGLAAVWKTVTLPMLGFCVVAWDGEFAGWFCPLADGGWACPVAVGFCAFVGWVDAFAGAVFASVGWVCGVAGGAGLVADEAGFFAR